MGECTQLAAVIDPVAHFAQPLALHLIHRQFIVAHLTLHLGHPCIQFPFIISFSIIPMRFEDQPCTGFVDLPPLNELPRISPLRHIGLLLVAQTVARSALILATDWQCIG